MREKTTSVDNYLLELGGPLTPKLLDIQSQLEEDGLLGINIGVTEGTLLAFLTKAFHVQSVLEIGTQYGYSTTWFLQNLSPSATIVSIEKNEEHFFKAKNNINDSRCQLILGDAKKILSEQLQSSAFDLVFIDANKKSYPNYLNYAKEHVNVGGLIVGDNSFLMNSVFAEPTDSKVDASLIEAMRLFNRELFSDSRFVSCIIPTTEGLTVGYKIKN